MSLIRYGHGALPKRFARRVKALRISKGFSYRVAGQLGQMSHASVRQIEESMQEPRLSQIERLRHVLAPDLTAGEFLDRMTLSSSNRQKIAKARRAPPPIRRAKKKKNGRNRKTSA